jgi:hypothetical protein
MATVNVVDAPSAVERLATLRRRKAALPQAGAGGMFGRGV